MTQSERDKISQLRGQIEATIELLYAIRGSLVNARDELYELLNREELNTHTTEEAEPIRHGKWVDRGSLSCRCSECGCKNDKETPFCPNCGAKMGLNNTYTTGHNENETVVVE